jgi:hypothetical protein
MEKITEVNCFTYKPDGEREYFGVQIEPTDDPMEALKKAKIHVTTDETYATGFYIDGQYYGNGTYKGLWELGIDEELIFLYSV